MGNEKRAAERMRESAAMLLLAAAGLLPRLLFVRAFPTLPVSDFAQLLEFGQRLALDGLAAGFSGWNNLNPGLPLILAGLMRLFPQTDPAALARTAAAAATGLLPLIPFLTWRGCVRLRARVLTGLLLALWPGQMLFSGVNAQDNWVLPPVVLLCALSARVVLTRGRGAPVLAALAYICAAAIRQEMLVILLPVLLVSAAGFEKARLARSLISAVTVLVLGLGVLTGWRGRATGVYALTTGHSGATLLGSYVPGAGLGWLDPKPFVAATEPQLLTSPDGYQPQAVRLAWGEVRRRPLYFAARLVSLPVSDMLTNFEGKLAYWSLTHPDALPPANQPDAARLADLAGRFLPWVSALLHSLFFAALLLVFPDRALQLALLPMLLVFLLKLGLHAVVVSQSRFYLPCIAVEMLVIGLAADRVQITSRGRLAACVLAGALIFGLLALAARAGQGYIQRHEETRQYHYSFPFHLGEARFTCEMNEGRLLAFYPGDSRAALSLDFLRPNPAPGERSRLTCRADGPPQREILLAVRAPLAGALGAGSASAVLTVNGATTGFCDLSEGCAQVFTLRPALDGSLSFAVELNAKGANAGRLAQTELDFTFAGP